LAFHTSRGRAIARPPSRSGPVMAIGQLVFVDSAGSRSGSVPLGDVSGKVVSSVHLADGVEVRVLEWRPRGANETRYRVQAPHGVDGWLPAENLRSTLVAVPRADRVEPATPPHATSSADPGARPFGQRRHSEWSPQPSPPAPVTDASATDDGPRRFGRR